MKRLERVAQADSVVAEDERNKIEAESGAGKK